MRRIARGFALALIWTLAAVLMVLEAALSWAWLRGTLYVLKFGAAENPYAAEDAEIAGLCALILLVPALAALAWASYRIILRCRKRAGARSER